MICVAMKSDQNIKYRKRKSINNQPQRSLLQNISLIVGYNFLIPTEHTV